MRGRFVQISDRARLQRVFDVGKIADLPRPA